MVFYDLTIAKYPTRIMPFTFKTQELPDCNKEGKELIKIRGEKRPDKWLIKDTGEEYQPEGKYKLISGKAIPQAQKTKEVPEAKVRFVDVNEKVVGSEATFWVDSPILQEKLEKEQQAIAFPYVNGLGWKVSKALIKLHPYNGKQILLMELGKRFLSEIRLEDFKKTQSITIKDKATEEDVDLLASL